MKTTNFTHRQSKTRCCLFKSDLFVGKFKFMTKLFTYVINYGGIDLKGFNSCVKV